MLQLVFFIPNLGGNKHYAKLTTLWLVNGVLVKFTWKLLLISWGRVVLASIRGMVIEEDTTNGTSTIM
jgi:hypothetical protein